MNRFETQRVSEQKRKILCRAEIRQPVPVERRFTTDNDVPGFEGFHRCEEPFGLFRGEVSVQWFVAISVNDADVRLSVVVTTNLPFEHWTEVLGSERLTGAALDRLTHRCHILEASGESFRLQDAKRRKRKRSSSTTRKTK